MSRKSSPDPGQDLDDRRHHAGEERHTPPFDVRAHVGGQNLHHERHQAERQIDHRLVRNECDHPHAGKSDDGADHVPAENRPEHVVPPLHDAPAVGEQLDDGEKNHAGRDVEISQQHAKQHHSAGHAEDAGEKRGKDDGGSDQSQDGGGHFGTSLRQRRSVSLYDCGRKQAAIRAPMVRSSVDPSPISAIGFGLFEIVDQRQPAHSPATATSFMLIVRARRRSYRSYS